MQNKILLCTMLLLCSICAVNVYAQIKVETSGKVKVSKNMSIGTTTDNNVSLNIYHQSGNTTPYYGIKSYLKTSSAMPTSPIYAIMGIADASASSGSYPINPIVGVCGKAFKKADATTKFCAGVAGMTHYYGGVGVYGGIGSDAELSLPTNWSSGVVYAGYFAGSVKVSGTLTATSLAVSSDSRLKENIDNLDHSLTSMVKDLRPISYTYRQDSTNIVYGESEKEMKKTHYGLIAQDVQRLFPNLVYEGGDGYLSINYIELIPVLIMSIQELSGEVKSLKEQLNVIKNQQ